MERAEQWMPALRRFAENSDFSRTFLVLDLDGTALLEDKGKVFISSSVEKGVKALHDLNVPIVLNTLRSPLSVINTIGHAWYQIADAPIPTVLLNGSIIGSIKCEGDDLRYEEISAHPLGPHEIKAILDGITQLAKAGIDDLLLFFYPRDWTEGEILWTLKSTKVTELKKKYVSASRVISGSVDKLSAELLRREICMTSLFINRPEDTLMAYQHGKRSSFFTAKGVNKASGLREIAARLGRVPANALGAGDTEMDTFLSEVGFAIIVGKGKLSFKGRNETLRVDSPLDLGELMLAYARLVKEKSLAVAA